MNCRRSVPILPVKDVRAALRHYKSLGFTADVYEADGTAIYGFLQREGLELHLNLFRELDPQANTSAVYFYVADPDSIYREWQEANVEGRLDPPEAKSWGMREMAYVDPDGNLLEFMIY